jgi:predicted dehydrogenase
MDHHAQAAGLVLMEAMHYRFHPLFSRIMECFQEIDPVSVETGFTFPVPDKSNIRHAYGLGGGALMDLGCYPVHLTRQLLQSEPEVISAVATVGNPDVDLRMEARLASPSGLEAFIVAGMGPEVPAINWLHASGSRGELRVEGFVSPHLGHNLRFTLGSETVEEVIEGAPSYVYQLREFCDSVNSGRSPLTTAVDAARTMSVIDAIYRTAGLKERGLASEKPEGGALTTN